MPQKALSMPLFIGVALNCVHDPRVLPPRDCLIEVCPGAAQSLNGTGPCAEGADLLIDGLDSAAMDAPGEEEDEPPAINALFWSVTFVHSEEAYSVPAIIDRRHCVGAIQEAQTRGF